MARKGGGARKGYGRGSDGRSTGRKMPSFKSGKSNNQKPKRKKTGY